MTAEFNAPRKARQELLNVNELAELLRISKTSVYRLVGRRQMPFHRLPRGLRFDRQDVDAFLIKTRVDSVDKKIYERKEI